MTQCLVVCYTLTMKTDIDQIKDKAVPILREAGVVRSAIFGSYARGEGQGASDVDVLVDLPRGKSLFDLVDLQMRLETALGKKVDVVTYNSLHPLLKDRILAEQVRIL